MNKNKKLKIYEYNIIKTKKFKRNYELYYLLKELIYELKHIIDDKPELNEEHVMKLLNYLKYLDGALNEH